MVRCDMAKKVTEDRLEKLELSSTDASKFTVRVSWSSSDYPEDEDLDAEDVIYLMWSDDEV